MSVSMSPRNTERIAGGASLAPRRWSLPALAMLMRSRPCHTSTARTTATQKNRNCMLACGVSPGFSRLLPRLSAMLQFKMFAGAVDARERLLVQQARQAVLRRHPLQRLHRHHLMVGGDVGALEDRRDFVLTGRDLVVARLDRHADLVELGFGFGHAREHALRNRAEVLILELLTLGRARAEQRAAGVDQVRAREIEVAVDQEVLLLGPAGGGHARRPRPEQLERTGRLRGKDFHRSQQRRLLVERLAGPADERSRDDERDAVAVLQQPRRAGGIPRRVAARFERAAHAARREARSIGLAPDELLCR